MVFAVPFTHEENLYKQILSFTRKNLFPSLALSACPCSQQINKNFLTTHSPGNIDVLFSFCIKLCGSCPATPPTIFITNLTEHTCPRYVAQKYLHSPLHKDKKGHTIAMYKLLVIFSLF